VLGWALARWHDGAVAALLQRGHGARLEVVRRQEQLLDTAATVGGCHVITAKPARHALAPSLAHAAAAGTGERGPAQPTDGGACLLIGALRGEVAAPGCESVLAQLAAAAAAALPPAAGGAAGRVAAAAAAGLRRGLEGAAAHGRARAVRACGAPSHTHAAAGRPAARRGGGGGATALPHRRETAPLTRHCTGRSSC
jgi:hypothetical protein